MFTHAAPASPTLATTTSSAQAGVPSSPTTRPSRLRGLSYLRNYTHALHRDSRDTSSPTTSPSPSGQSGAAGQAGTQARASSTAASVGVSAGPSSAAQRRQSLSRTTSYPPSPGRGAYTQRQNQTEGSTPDFDARVREATVHSDHLPAPALGQPSMPFITGTPASLHWSGGGRNPHVDVVQSALAQAAGLPALTAEARDATSLTSAPQLRAPLRDAGSEAPPVRNGNTSLMVVSTPSPPPPADFRPTIRFSQHQDPRAPRPSLMFTPMGRTLPTGTEVIKVGRYSERETAPNQPANMSTAAPVGFKSKVVSRRHCEFWVEEGQWFIKDVKSSSGTFLNHVRLSPPNTESRPYPVKDGDIVQLGIDFKGGEEMIFRCVKIRVEVNRGWQAGLNSFNVSSHRMLKKMTKGGDSSSSNDCSICLSGVAPCQALFVAPCSHTWHYKCIRPVLDGPHFPHFTCPNCRAVADLDADVDEPTEGEWEELDLALEQSQANASAASGANGASVAPVPVAAPTHPQVQTQTQAAVSAAEEEHAQLSTVGVTAIPPPATASPLQPGGLIGAELMSSPAVATPSIATRPTSLEQEQQRLSERMSSPPNEVNATAASKSFDTALESARATALPSPQGSATMGLTSPIAIRDSRPGPRGRGSPEQRSETSPIDNPMTPRNDAGPFILDGRAGAASDENAHGNEAGW